MSAWKHDDTYRPWGAPDPEPELTREGRECLVDAVRALEYSRDSLPPIHEVRELDGEAAEMVLTALDALSDAATSLADLADMHGIKV